MKEGRRKEKEPINSFPLQIRKMLSAWRDNASFFRFVSRSSSRRLAHRSLHRWLNHATTQREEEQLLDEQASRRALLNVVEGWWHHARKCRILNRRHTAFCERARRRVQIGVFGAWWDAVLRGRVKRGRERRGRAAAAKRQVMKGCGCLDEWWKAAKAIKGARILSSHVKKHALESHLRSWWFVARWAFPFLFWARNFTKRFAI